MRIRFAGCSRAGLVRDSNEDAYLMHASDQSALFLVADGIGGRTHGKDVSTMLRDSYDSWWRNRFLPMERAMPFQTAVEEIKEILFAQNQAVVQQFGPLQAGSTLVLLFLTGGKCLYLSCGDSRIYRLKGLSLRQITMDDVYENLTDKSDGSNAGLRGKLVGAVGLRSTPDFTIRTETLQRGTAFFLCSDGVYRYIAPKRLGKRLRFGLGDSEKLIAGIAEEVERNGAGDNYSMIHARVTSL